MHPVYLIYCNIQLSCCLSSPHFFINVAVIPDARNKMRRIWQDARGESSRNSFQRSLCPLLVAGQFFALMPVSGLMGHDASTLRFRWCSLRVAFSLFSMLGISFLLGMQAWDLYDTPDITYSACGA